MSEETKKVTLYKQKDQEGNPVAPLVPERGIYDEDGVRLDDKLKIVNLKRVDDAIASGIETIKKEGDTQVAEVQKQLPTLKHQIGLDKYKKFNNSTNYQVGDVVLREDRLYKYKVAHAAGAWNPQEVIEISMEQDLEEKIGELDSNKLNKNKVVQESGEAEDKVMSQKAVTAKLIDLSNKIKGFKQEESITYDTTSGYVYKPFHILGGNDYKVTIKRTDSNSNTCQFGTFTEKTTGSRIDTLENLSFNVPETTFYFTASANANYIGMFSSKQGVSVKFILEIESIVGPVEKKIADEEQRAKNAEIELSKKMVGVQTSRCINNIVGVQTRRCINNIVKQNNVNSSSTYRFVNSMLPKNSKIIEFTYYAANVGTTKLGIWKYENNTLTLMETLDITSEIRDATLPISALEDRYFDYNVFFSFINTSGVDGSIGWRTDIGNQLSLSADGKTEIGTTVSFNDLSATIGNQCISIKYAMDINNYPKEKTNQGVLEVGANKQYKTIQEAVNVAVDGNTILVYAGVYNEQVQAWGKEIHIVGIDKNTCILQDTSGYYYTPPLELSAGSVSNLTIKEYATNPPEGADSVIIPGTGLSAKNMAYCIHMDWEGNSKGNVVISDCILWNKNRPCIGSGLAANKSLTIRNCVMYSGVADEGKSRGAMYCHASSSAADGQLLVIDNCEIVSADNLAMTLRGYDGGSMNVKLTKNIIWSEKDGKAQSVVDENFGNGITLHPISYGNNIESLNK